MELNYFVCLLFWVVSGTDRDDHNDSDEEDVVVVIRTMDDAPIHSGEMIGLHWSDGM